MFKNENVSMKRCTVYDVECVTARRSDITGGICQKF